MLGITTLHNGMISTLRISSHGFAFDLWSFPKLVLPPNNPQQKIKHNSTIRFSIPFRVQSRNLRCKLQQKFMEITVCYRPLPGSQQKFEKVGCDTPWTHERKPEWSIEHSISSVCNIRDTVSSQCQNEQSWSLLCRNYTEFFERHSPISSYENLSDLRGPQTGMLRPTSHIMSPHMTKHLKSTSSNQTIVLMNVSKSQRRVNHQCHNADTFNKEGLNFNTLPSYSFRARTSGAMYAGVPTVDFGCECNKADCNESNKHKKVKIMIWKYNVWQCETDYRPLSNRNRISWAAG